MSSAGRAAAATPVFKTFGFTSYSTHSTAAHATAQVASIFTVVTLVTGGSANVTVASVAIVKQPTATYGSATVSHTGAHACYVSMTPTTKLTQANSATKSNPRLTVKFGICKGRATYTASSPTCSTDTIFYGTPGPTHDMGWYGGSLAGVNWTTVEVATTYPATGTQDRHRDRDLRPPAGAGPRKGVHNPHRHSNHHVLGDIFAWIIQAPPTTKFTETYYHAVGGTKTTAGVAGAYLCTSSDTPYNRLHSDNTYKSRQPSTSRRSTRTSRSAT